MKREKKTKKHKLSVLDRAWLKDWNEKISKKPIVMTSISKSDYIAPCKET